MRYQYLLIPYKKLKIKNPMVEQLEFLQATYQLGFLILSFDF